MTESEPHLSEKQEATPRELARLAARTAARDARERQHTLPLPKVALWLGVSEHEVIALTASGDLCAHTLSPDRQRWPAWQFAYGSPLPHLREVVAAIPAGAHPTGVRTLMTAPHPDLVVEVLDRPVSQLLPEIRVSPANWLSGGGSPTPVMALLAAFAGAI